MKVYEFETDETMENDNFIKKWATVPAPDPKYVSWKGLVTFDEQERCKVIIDGSKSFKIDLSTIAAE